MSRDAQPVRTAGRVAFRSPTVADGAAMWQIVRSLPTLDDNSPYCYLMVCRSFADTSIVAVDGEQVVGFVTAFRPPNDPSVLFVWQVAVAPEYQGQGVGREMLDALLRQPGCAQVRFVEATVTPSNVPSQKTFESLARRLDTSCEVSECFPGSAFPGGNHEEEQLYRIGPF